MLCVNVVLGQSVDWLLEPSNYADISYMGHDLFKFKTKGKSGIYNAAKQEFVLEARYDSITNMVEGQAIALDATGENILAIINGRGAVKDLSSRNYVVSSYPHFKEGYLVYGDFNENLYGYLDKEGRIAIKPQFYQAAPFQQGIASVKYPNEQYGLINTAGSTAIFSDTEFLFLSSPVNGQTIGKTNSTRGGNQLKIYQIEGAKLKEVKTLESKVGNISISGNFTQIGCALNSHIYYLDDQQRVTHANFSVNLPQVNDVPEAIITESQKSIGKKRIENGFNLTYEGHPFMEELFKSAAIYDDKYIVARSSQGALGILGFNPTSAVHLKSPAKTIIFYHNEKQDIEVPVVAEDVDLNNLRFYIEENGIRQQLTTINGNLIIPYFSADSQFNNIKKENITIAITKNEMEWQKQSVSINSVHEVGYTVNISGPQTTAADGTATITIAIQAKNKTANTSARISVNGQSQGSISGQYKTITQQRDVPKGKTLSFTFTVVIIEDGCPNMQVSKTLSITNPSKEPIPDPKPIIIH
jgi:hypothetical protein